MLSRRSVAQCRELSS